jgi:hypothetical protein
MAFVLLGAGGGGEGAALQVGDLDPTRVTHAFHIVFGVLAVFAALAALAAWRAPCMDLRKHAAQGRR